ncbi:protein KIAA0556 homolog [Diaphorina citri]|uniref:Protein KIAA0556 homolog n=1 Tax=Diaphorina citri TaxID=121845 RepID=A0A3Q0J597_DIACI|nr:protein KIAA0556 homolog [Diaphorina citri]
MTDSPEFDPPLTADTGGIRPLTSVEPISAPSHIPHGALVCYGTMTLNLLSNYGHPTLIGLTGISVLDDTGNRVHTDSIQVMNTVDHSVENLLLNNDCMSSLDTRYMWCTPYRRGLVVTLVIKFSQPVHISALIVWNYNASIEMSYCGVSKTKNRAEWRAKLIEHRAGKRPSSIKGKTKSNRRDQVLVDESKRPYTSFVITKNKLMSRAM